MALIIKLLIKMGLLQEERRFKTGDQVERKEGGGALMIVESVTQCKDSKSLILACKWFDSRTRQTKIETFSENEVKRFDWYHAN